MRVAFHNPKNPTFYERWIRLKTGGPYVHTELIFDEVSRNSGYYISFSSIINIGARFQNEINFLTEEWEILALPERNNSEKVYDYCKGLEGKAYDLLGICGFILPWGEHDDRDIFCSESTTDALQFGYSMGTLFPPQKAWLVSPMKLYRLLNGQ